MTMMTTALPETFEVAVGIVSKQQLDLDEDTKFKL